MSACPNTGNPDKCTCDPTYYESHWSKRMRSMLGKQVEVLIDRGDDVRVRGKLVMFDDGGEVALRGDDGFIRWAWPNLEAKEVR